MVNIFFNAQKTTLKTIYLNVCKTLLAMKKKTFRFPCVSRRNVEDVLNQPIAFYNLGETGLTWTIAITLKYFIKSFKTIEK